MIEIPGLNIQDSMVFKSICELSLEKGSDWIGLEEIQELLVNNYLEEDEYLDSIEILAEELFIEGEKTLDGKINYLQIISIGFQRYARIYLPEFEALLDQVLSSIVQRNVTDNKSLSASLG